MVESVQIDPARGACFFRRMQKRFRISRLIDDLRTAHIVVSTVENQNLLSAASPNHSAGEQNRSMTMKITAAKTLMLAAIGVVSIGAGSAMAQTRTIYPGVGFAPPKVIITGTAANAGANQPQYGSSDTDLNAPLDPRDYRYQWGNLANPG
jgi:hypothetical protein